MSVWGIIKEVGYQLDVTDPRRAASKVAPAVVAASAFIPVVGPVVAAAGAGALGAAKGIAAINKSVNAKDVKPTSPLSPAANPMGEPTAPAIPVQVPPEDFFTYLWHEITFSHPHTVTVPGYDSNTQAMIASLPAEDQSYIAQVAANPMSPPGKVDALLRGAAKGVPVAQVGSAMDKLFR